MPSADQVVQAYRELAESYDRQGQTPMRDRFLVLAVDAAFAAGLHDQAEHLRADLLRQNPHHLLKPYHSFAEAMKSADVQNYVSALRRSHPYERVNNLRESLRRHTAVQESADEAKVFSLQKPHITRDLAPVYPTRPYERAAAESSSTASGPPPAPDTYRLQRAVEISYGSPSAPADDEWGTRLTRWVSLGLFVLVLLAGVSLAIHTFARPFLKEWKW
jgi:hypothetical protein